MQVIDAIYQRRSVKHFDPDFVITQQAERELLEATIQSPTSFNIQHWRFVIFRDPALKAHIRWEIGNDQSQITDASLLVLFVADPQAWRKKPERYWANAPAETRAQLVEMLTDFYRGRDALQRDEAQRSIGMAMQSLMLAAEARGYQSCPMIGYDIDALAELIELPDDYVMGPMVAIGRGTKAAHPKGGQLPLDTLVVDNGFGVSASSVVARVDEPELEYA